MPFFLFIVYILLEIAMFAWLGSLLGVGWVLLLVLLSAVLGIYLMRSVANASRNLMAELQSGIRTRPNNPKFHRLLSGVLLITPGFVSDALGLLLLVPPIRHALFGRLWAKGAAPGETGFVETRYYEVEINPETIEGKTIDPESNRNYH